MRMANLVERPLAGNGAAGNRWPPVGGAD
jgi:hypothetical protein